MEFEDRISLGVNATLGCKGAASGLAADRFFIGFNNSLKNGWNHVACVYQQGGVQGYVNGINQSDNRVVSVGGAGGNQSIVLLTNTFNLTIGASITSTADGTPTLVYNGSIDNVRIYNKALTSSEIADHYNKVKLYYTPSFKFDGSNDFINISYSSSLNASEQISIEFWLNPRNALVERPILSKSTSAGDDWYIQTSGTTGKIIFSLYNHTNVAKTVLTNTVLSNNNWYHVVETYNTSTLNIYINGISENTALTSGRLRGLRQDIMIGAYANAIIGDVFNGSIDNVRIYNKALTSNEIQDHYEKYKLYYSPSFKFDGVNDYINVTATSRPSLNMTGNKITLEAWINLKSYNAGGTNTDKASIIQKTGSYYMTINTSNGRLASLFNGVTSEHENSNSNVSLNVWNHVAITYDGSNIRWYINGSLDKTASFSGNIGKDERDVVIGGEPDFGRFLNGSITQVRIYNRSLSANQIYELYNSYNTSALNKLVSEETTAGRTYKASLYASDTFADSSQVNTSELLIGRSTMNFTLSSPSNNTISTNTTQLLIWNNVSDISNNDFSNYTVEVDDNADFSSIQFTYLRTSSVTNSSFQVTTPWNVNTRYFWRAIVRDVANNQNTSNTFTYTTDNTNPTVTLDSPINNQQLTTSTVNFRYVPTDAPFNANLQACDLYGNFTSTTFIKNNSQLSPVAGAINTFTLTLTDRSYTWNVQCNDTAGNYANASSNFAVNIDTVRPLLSYEPQTEVNNSYKNQNFIFVNWTYTETNFANLTFRLFNTTSNVNTTVYNTTPNYQINVSNYTSYLINPNERYTYNLTLRDLSNQENITETRTITLDNTNPLISYSAQTLTNNTYINSNSIFVNWTYTETNFANLTFTLTNLTAIINQTIYNTTAYQINITSLTNTNYSYNVTIRDLANNYNATETRVLVLDNIIPVPVYDSRTEINNTYINRNWTFINITLTEINLA
ncbi:MAG: LamG-like jellyroll fold domain-containing protein, partial [Nanoarchaeota archaeon]